MHTNQHTTYYPKTQHAPIEIGELLVEIQKLDDEFMMHIRHLNKVAMDVLQGGTANVTRGGAPGVQSLPTTGQGVISNDDATPHKLDVEVALVLRRPLRIGQDAQPDVLIGDVAHMLQSFALALATCHTSQVRRVPVACSTMGLVQCPLCPSMSPLT